MSYRKALKKFERQDPIRILFEEGAADGQPSGSPLPRFEATFTSWPIADGQADRLVPHARRQAARHAVDGRAGRGRGSAATSPTRRRCRRRRTPARARASGQAHPTYRLAADPGGHGPRLDQRAAEEERRRRSAPARWTCGSAPRAARHRPRGDPDRGAAQRPGDLRAVRLAPHQPPQARPRAVDADLAGAHRPGGGRQPAAGAGSSRRSGSSCSRSRSRSARARGCGSPSTRPAAPGRPGPSTHDRARRAGQIAADSGAPFAAGAAASCRASTCPARRRCARSLRSQPCRTYAGSCRRRQRLAARATSAMTSGWRGRSAPVGGAGSGRPAGRRRRRRSSPGGRARTCR